MSMLIESTGESGNFIGIKHGALCLDHPKPRPQTDAEFEAALAKGYVIVEGEVDGVPFKNAVKKFEALVGRIVKIEWSVRPEEIAGRGKVTFRAVKLFLRHEGEFAIIDLPYEKRHCDYFLRIAESIDYAEEVRFETWLSKKGRNVTGLVIKQNGKNILWAYPPENPGDCPPVTQDEITQKWDFDTQRKWLLDRLINVVAPKVAEMYEQPEPEYDEEYTDQPLTHTGTAPIASDIADPALTYYEEDNGLDAQEPALPAEPPMPPFIPSEPAPAVAPAVAATASVAATPAVAVRAPSPPTAAPVQPALGGYNGNEAMKATPAQMNRLAGIATTQGVSVDDLVIQEFVDIFTANELGRQGATYLIQKYGSQ